jgi:HlyD family secretion protein
LDRKIEKKVFYKRKRFWIYSGGIILFLLLVGLILTDTGSKLNVDTQKITISTVSKNEFQEFIPVSGTVLPKTTYYLDAILGGTVEQKFIEEGTMVPYKMKRLLISKLMMQEIQGY